MKDQNLDIDINTSIQNSEDYEIVNNAHMARILSEQYANPIAAVIRELSTNAYDAHLEANNEAPFEVSLMVWGNSPELIIRDFGNGLSKQQLSEIYKKYGKSTKNESDDYVGMLGIGSKSPFAYTDSFITISRNNGKKITVINTKNEEGLPKFYVAAEEDTKEPSGLEVKIPVNKNDIGNFISNMTEIFRWFDKKPKINIALNKSKYIDPLLSFSNFEVYNDNYSNHLYSKVIMGNVAYNISHSEIKFIFDELNIPSHITYIIKVNIGDVNFTPSREELMYTKKTLECIRQNFIKFKEELSKEIERLINNCKSYFEANRTYFNKLYPPFESLLNYKIFYYKGKSLQNKIELPSDIEMYSAWGRAQFPKTFDIKYHFNAGFLYADKKTGRKQASRALLSQSNYGQVFCLLTDDKKRIKEFVDLIGIDISDIEPCSSYYKRVGQTRNTKVIKDKGFIFCPNKDGIKNYSSSNNLRYWDYSSDFDVNNYGLYVELNRYNIVYPDIQTYNIYPLMAAMAKEFIHFQNIYGIKSTLIKKVEATGKWKNSITYMKDFIKNNTKIKEAKENSLLSQELYLTLHKNNITRHYTTNKDKFPELNKICSKFPKEDNNLAGIIDLYNSVFTNDKIIVKTDDKILAPLKEYISEIGKLKINIFTNYYQRFQDIEYLLALEAKDKGFKL